MATAKKKKKLLTYKGKPLLRCGNRVYYGYLDDKYILVLDIIESEKMNDIEISKKVLLRVMDNTGELGQGEVFRKTERESLYAALDTGEWWLKQAIQNS